MKQEHSGDFGTGSVSRAIVRMAVPMMLAELVNVLYSVVDRMYIGHIPGAGDLSLTGLGITVPIVTITTAFASLCGAGGGPLCAIARGEGDQKKAERIIGNTFSMLLLFSLLLTAVFSLGLTPILRLFGASERSLPYARQYASVYVWGTVFAMLSFGMNYFINAQGFARTGMLTIAIGAVINIALDPVFIFALGLGIRGAAIATVIAQMVSCAWVLGFLRSGRAPLRLRREALRPDGETVRSILGLGTSGFVMKSTTGLVQILYNIQLRRYGGDLYIGSMTIINSLRDVMFMTFHGLTNGFQPVLGFNYGAKRYDRVREGIRFSTLAGLGYAAVCWALAMLLPRPLARIFTNDEALLATCVPAMRVFFSCFVVKALQMVGQYTYVALGHAKKAVFFSLLRKVIIVLPLLYLLPEAFGLGAMGVFYTEPAADLLSSTACYLTMFLTVYRAMPAENKN